MTALLASQRQPRRWLNKMLPSVRIGCLYKGLPSPLVM